MVASLAVRHFWMTGFIGPPSALVGRSGRPEIGRLAPGQDQPCDGCHSDEGDLHGRGPHRSLLCSECHGLLESHVSDGEVIAPMKRIKSVTRLCSRCHRRLREERGKTPQLNLEAHVVEVGALFSDEVCFDCHRPHDPRP